MAIDMLRVHSAVNRDPTDALIDEGEAGLHIVAASDMRFKVRSAMVRYQEIEDEQLKVEPTELEADIAERGRRNCGHC